MTVSNSSEPDHPIPPIRDPGEMDKESLKEDALLWIRSRPDAQNVWIFATGSLMWNPDFAVAESRRGRIEGWHRAFCLYSLSYRGCPAKPGLVMGLAPGGICDGIAFRIDPNHLEEAAISIWQREMSHDSYRMIDVEIETKDGSIQGYSLTPTEGHPQYAVGLPEILCRPQLPVLPGSGAAT